MEFTRDYFCSLTRPCGDWAARERENPPFLRRNYSERISSTLLSALLGQELHEGTLLFPHSPAHRYHLQPRAIFCAWVHVCARMSRPSFSRRRACPCVGVHASCDLLLVLLSRRPSSGCGSAVSNKLGCAFFLLRTAAAVRRRLTLEVPAEPQSGATACQSARRLIQGPVRPSVRLSVCPIWILVLQQRVCQSALPFPDAGDAGSVFLSPSPPGVA